MNGRFAPALAIPERSVAPGATNTSWPALPGVSGSLALHGLLLVLAVTLALAPRHPPAERPVSVEILTPEQFEALTVPRPASPAPVAPSATTEPRPQPASRPQRTPPATGMVEPTEMLSAGTLADPRSRQARVALAGLDDTERMIQLCDLEAIEQVRAWRTNFTPTLVVAYALADVAVGGELVEARGAAFRSGEDWYRLAFRCRLAADHRAVIAFAFKVGAPVPRDQWEAHGLPAEDKEAD